MRVLVCGGRDFSNVELLVSCLDEMSLEQPISVVIHGAARGADRLGGQWAEARGLIAEAYPADWERYGRRAGPIRNQQMLDEGKPDLVVAFPGGRGTADMVKRAKLAGVRVVEVAA